MNPEESGARTGRYRTGAGLLAVVILIYMPVLAPGQAFWYRDIYGFWSALVDSLVRAVSSGAPPLWNPWISFGMPMLADPGTQTLYPPTWLNLLLPLTTYYKVYAVAHAFGSACGLYLLARRLGCARLAAGAGAVAWIASGPFQELLSHTHHFAGAAWLPWLLVALHDALAAGTPRSAARLGLVAAAQVLAGSGDMCLLTAFIALAFVLFRAGAMEARAIPRRLTGVALVAVPIALLASAAQWLPTVDLLRSGMRLGMAAEASTYWSLHPASLLEILIPGALSDLPVSDAVRSVLYESREPLYATLYLGAPCAVLVVLGALAGSRLARAAGAGFVLALVVALGRHTPIYAALAAVTPLSILRYPTKYTVAAAFFWSLLVACGAEALLGASDRRPRRLAALFGALLSASFLGAATFLTLRPQFLAGLVVPDAEALSTSLRATLAKLVVCAALTAFASLALAWPSGARLRLALLAAAGIDLIAVAQGVNPTAPRELIEYRPVAAALPPEARVYVSMGEGRAWLPQQVVRAPLGWARAWAIARSRTDLLWPPLNARYGLRGSYNGDFTGLGAPLLSNLTLIVSDAQGKPVGERLLQVAGVDFVVTADDHDWPGFALEKEIPALLARPIRVLRVPQTRPPVLFVGRTRIVPDPESIHALASADFEPLHETVLAAGPSLETGGDFDGTVRVVERRPDRLRVATTATRPGVLVVLDAFDPGWHATLDGRATGILRADVLFKAVAVPAGSHEIELRYRPVSIALGAALSLVGLVVAALLAAPARVSPAVARPAGAR